MSGELEGIIVVGAGGHGKSMISILSADHKKVVAVLDDDPKTWKSKILGVPVLGPMKLLDEYPNNPICNGIGSNKKRESVVKRFPNAKWTGFRSSLAYINPQAKIGIGTVIFPFAVVGAEANIGEHAIISTHTTLGHDVVIGDFAQVAPGVQVAGGAFIEDTVMLGIGSAVCPNVRIGMGATLAAGAVAVTDVAPDTIVFGTPAKP